MVELQARDEFDTNKDGSVSEEEITVLIGEGIDSVDLDQFISTVWPKIKDVYKMPAPKSAEPIESPPTDSESPPSDDGAPVEEEDDDSDFDEVS